MMILNHRRIVNQLMAACALVFTISVAQAQASPAAADEATVSFQPSSGQSGKDVVWIPTPQSLVDSMLRMAAITPDDYLIDLGSGDGRTVITAAQQGTRAHGIEFNPDMVEFARGAAKQAGVSEMATFAQGDIFESDFSDATVVTLFLLPRLNLRLRPILLDMKPGTRVVSNSFDMEDWKPDESVDQGTDCESYCHAYLWIVPAKVEGQWQLNNGATLTLTQTFQKLAGHLALNGTQHEITDAAMQGTNIAFSANGVRYTGNVNDNTLSGTDGQGKSWKANRQ